MTGLRITAAAFGILVACLGAMLLISGHDNLTSSARDADGYIMFDPATFERMSTAIVISDMDVLKGRFLVHAGDSGVPGWAIEDLEVRMRGSTSGPAALFMGVAPSSEVDTYLTGVTHDEMTDLELEVAEIRSVEYERHEGTTTPSTPGAELFWATAVEGTGLLTLDWTVRPGDWSAVIMNADASSGVGAELVFGAQASNIDTIGWTKIVTGLVALIGGALGAFLALRGRNREPEPPRDDIYAGPYDRPMELSPGKYDTFPADPRVSI
jgi:hypothetical protein